MLWYRYTNVDNDFVSLQVVLATTLKFYLKKYVISNSNYVTSVVSLNFFSDTEDIIQLLRLINWPSYVTFIGAPLKVFG